MHVSRHGPSPGESRLSSAPVGASRHGDILREIPVSALKSHPRRAGERPVTRITHSPIPVVSGGLYRSPGPVRLVPPARGSGHGCRRRKVFPTRRWRPYPTVEKKVRRPKGRTKVTKLKCPLSQRTDLRVYGGVFPFPGRLTSGTLTVVTPLPSTRPQGTP